MKFRHAILIVTILSCFTNEGLGQTYGASVPDSISVQGFLTDSNGVPINVPKGVGFKLFRGSDLILNEAHLGLPISNGVFNAIVGIGGSLGGIPFNEPIELEINVEGEIQTPRTPILATPYALAVRGLNGYEVVDGGFRSVNLIGGAANNWIADGSLGATIGGGGGWNGNTDYSNSVTDDWGTVGGGRSNAAELYGTVAGGVVNSAGERAAVGGGYLNIASGFAAAIAGGNDNQSGGDYSTVSGGTLNVASGESATVPGGYLNLASGNGSFAAGTQARALHDGSFVFSDRSTFGSNDRFDSTDDNQFLIRASGGVAIGTSTITHDVNVFDVDDDGDAVLFLEASSPEPRELMVGVNQSSGGGFVSLRTNGSLFLRTNDLNRVRIDSAGHTRFSGDIWPASDNVYSVGRDGNRWSEVWAAEGTINSSDQRLKNNISPIAHGLEDVLLLEPVSYQWKDNPDRGVRLGLIAQDTEKIVPEVVRRPSDETGYYGLNYEQLVPVLIKAIQEQQDQIDALKSENERTLRRIATLEAALTN